MKLLVKKLNDEAILPTRGTSSSAGYDLYNYGKHVDIAPGRNKLIDLGIAVEIPEGYYGAIYARSGLSTKQGLRPATCVSVIDSDYRGPLSVAIYNDSEEYQRIKSGDRVAQLVILPYEACAIVEVDELSQTERGEGGYGSTGK